MKYRSGFNGMETDLETNLQDYGMRIYNPSLSRFLSIDPITRKYAMLTPYQFASNRPIDGIDLDGLEFCNPFTVIRKKLNETWTGKAALFTLGMMNTPLSTAQSTYDFVTNDACKSETWTNLGKNFLAVSTIGNQYYTVSTSYFFGVDPMETIQRQATILNGIIKSIENITNMDAMDWGNFGGEILVNLLPIKKLPPMLGSGLKQAKKWLKGFDKAVAGINDLKKTGKVKSNSFDEIFSKGDDITFKKSAPQVSANASAHKSFAGLMEKYGKKIEDLTISNEGSTMYFTTENGNITYSLYKQTSKGDFGEWRIREEIKGANGNISEKKIRFKED